MFKLDEPHLIRDGGLAETLRGLASILACKTNNLAQGH